MSKPSNVDQYKKIYNDITRKGYCKIKLFTKDDINKFKKKIISILNKKNLMSKIYQTIITL